MQRGCRLDIKSILVYPLGQFSYHCPPLFSGKPYLIGELNVVRQREIRMEASIWFLEQFVSAQWKRRWPELSFVLVNRGYLKRHRPSSGILPIRNVRHGRLRGHRASDRNNRKQQRHSKRSHLSILDFCSAFL